MRIRIIKLVTWKWSPVYQFKNPIPHNFASPNRVAKVNQQMGNIPLFYITIPKTFFSSSQYQQTFFLRSRNSVKILRNQQKSQDIFINHLFQQ